MQEAGVKECRICKAEEGELVAPCACKGSMKWVHEVCLVSWLKARRQRGARERDACEVCGETVWVRITGTDFLLFPYSAATHDLGDPLLISVLVLAVLTSTTAFLLCTAMETMEVNLWSTVIRWVLTPAIMLLKAGLLHAWLCSAPKKLEHFTSHLMRVFTIIPSLSELLFVSFLNTTRIIFATMTEEGDKVCFLDQFIWCSRNCIFLDDS